MSAGFYLDLYLLLAVIAFMLLQKQAYDEADSDPSFGRVPAESKHVAMFLVTGILGLLWPVFLCLFLWDCLDRLR